MKHKRQMKRIMAETGGIQPSKYEYYQMEAESVRKEQMEKNQIKP